MKCSIYLKECCEFVHELEHIPEVDERDVHDGAEHHEKDGVEVLNLIIKVG